MRSVGPNKRENYEKEFTIDIIRDAMRLWMRAAGDGLPLPAIGRDTPQRAYRLRRNPHLCG